MSDIVINVKVSARAAIMAAKTVVGVHKVKVTAEDLLAVSEGVREEIAALVESNATLEDPSIAEPTFSAIRPILERAAEARKALNEEARKAEARRAEEAAVQARKTAARDNARSKALRTWVEKNGDDEMKARMAEGFLKEEEILDEVADDLIDLRGFPPYEAMLKGEVCDCACAGAVEFTVGPPQYLDAFQFARLTEIRELLPEGGVAEAQEHRGVCPRCKCIPTARITAKVTLPWEGWQLVREFLLK